MENTNIQYEKTIFLETLVVACLKKWRMIGLVTVIAAAVLGVAECIMQVMDGSVQGKDIVFKIILGLVLGLMVSAGCVVAGICIKVFFGKYLFSMQDFCKQLNIPVLACLYVPKGFERKEKITRFERWVEHLEGADRVVDVENAYKIADAKIQVMAKDNRKVLLVGTGSQSLEEVCEALKRNCTGDCLEYVFANELLENREGILRLKDSVVVVAEKENETEFKKIMGLIGFFAYSRAEIVGMIIF